MSGSNSSPLERYELDLQQPAFVADGHQRAAVEILERIYQELVGAQAARPASNPAFGGMFGNRRRAGAARTVKGLYLHGGVGRGKTYLVDTFHDALPFENKLRTHFHRFMQRIHAELKTLGGRQDPLQSVAERLAAETCVLCFDEFHVSDITDAMLLGRLMQALFSRGVTLVTTSNIGPDDLYKNGLQRQRFLPAIDEIKRHTEVMHLAGDEDFRLRTLEQAEIYHHPDDATAERNLLDAFVGLTGTQPQGGSIEVLGRVIETRAERDGVVWFAFDAICDGPRGAADYIEVAREYHTVLLSGVPSFGLGDNDRAARFIAMVDEFYDRSVNLLVSAVAPPRELYQDGRHAFAFERTVSRLIEMRSRDYLRQPHLPT